MRVARFAGKLGQVSSLWFTLQAKAWTGTLVGLSIVSLLCGGGLLRAQQSPPVAAANRAADQPDTTTVSVNVKVVNVLATVRDKHGKIVSDLGKDDFTLAEDGHAVTIGYFSRETDLPLTLGLLVDTSMSQRQVLEQERSASKAF
jgi:hypothetical protein